MRHSEQAALAALALALCIASAAALWPVPRRMRIDDADTLLVPLPNATRAGADTDDRLAAPRLWLPKEFRIEHSSKSPRLLRGISRYTALLQQKGLTSIHDANVWLPIAQAIRRIVVVVEDDSSTLPHIDTNYSYTVIVIHNTVRIHAATIYGVLYALETFTQLVLPKSGGQLPAVGTINIADRPSYRWRGLLVDTGRRFFPMSLLKNLLDTMAAVKLNVLHFHMSDWCRFAVESTRFPHLTQSLQGEHLGHYTQADIKELIEYAADRGIRVVPEVDVPSHAGGMQPLKADSAQFCGDFEHAAMQLYYDPEGQSIRVVRQLLTEMANLFPDQYFHIGGDEPDPAGPCDNDNAGQFVRAAAHHLKSLKKNPIVWADAVFGYDANLPLDVIINTWSTDEKNPQTAALSLERGYKTLESAMNHFYFTDPAPGVGAEGWHMCWYDIAHGVERGPQLENLLGREISMWTDNYLPYCQCGAYSWCLPRSTWLYDRNRDTQFAKSIGGMIWPRGFVAAGSFWSFSAHLDPNSTDFEQAIWTLNEELAARGSLVCPNLCSCDFDTACGKNYNPRASRKKETDLDM